MQPLAARPSPGQETKHLQESPNENVQSTPAADIKTSSPKKTNRVFRLLPTIALTVAAGLWGMAGRIPIRVVGQSVLMQPRSIISFQPRGSSGQVLEIRVKPGDRVKVGEIIAVLDLPELRDQLETQNQKLAELEQDNLAITNAQDRRSTLQEQTLQLEGLSIPQQIESNLSQIEANKIELVAAEKQRQAYQERIEQLNQYITITQQRLQAFDKLVAQRVIAPLSTLIISAENQFQQNQNERTKLFAQLEDLNSKEEQLNSKNIALEAQNKNLRSQLENLRTQSANLNLEDLTADVQRRNEIDNLKRDIQNLKTKIATDSKVVATHNGTVITVSANPGQYVQVGSQIGTLRVEGTQDRSVTAYAYAFFTPEDANRIWEGMTADVTPNLLTDRRFGGTREQYGAIPSQVLWVSPKTVTEQDVASMIGDADLASALMQNPVAYSIPDNGRATNLPVVQVELKLETNPDTPTGYQWTQGNGPDVELPEGAIGEARVTVAERSPISYVVSFFRWMTGIYHG